MHNPSESSILLVEDSEHDIFLLKRAFQKARIANPLNSVEDGEQAIEYLLGGGIYADRSRYPIPVLMLLDLRLPTLSGFEVLRWIRDQEAFDQMIVAVLSGSASLQDMHRAYSLGANSYLVKPGNPDELAVMAKRIEARWLPLLSDERIDSVRECRMAGPIPGYLAKRD